jgi:hypothetical protein
MNGCFDSGFVLGILQPTHHLLGVPVVAFWAIHLFNFICYKMMVDLMQQMGLEGLELGLTSEGGSICDFPFFAALSVISSSLMVGNTWTPIPMQLTTFGF